MTKKELGKNFRFGLDCTEVILKTYIGTLRSEFQVQDSQEAGSCADNQKWQSQLAH
jgi:hypothetical protein